MQGGDRGPPRRHPLSADRDTITTGMGDVAHVTFEIVDSAGTVVPTTQYEVQFAISGGSILALDNANLRDLDSPRSGERRAFNGRGLAILRAAQPGRFGSPPPPRVLNRRAWRCRSSAVSRSM